ncbi:MAG: PDZ domain-containing protein, partial [Firmicutes bacterium]|nr:PDZ domain-containing protein [Bacillota bacterium]
RDSTAWTMGLRSGDILMAVNGIPVRERRELGYAVESRPGSLEIEYLAGGRVYRRGITHRGDKTRPLGILPVAAGEIEGYIEINTPGLLRRVIDSWRKKFKR